MDKKSRNKILYLVTKSNWGGAQRYVYDLATHLPPDRYEVIVAGGGRGPLFEKLKKHKVKVIGIPSLGRDIGILKDVLSFWKLLRLFLSERPDVVHLNSSKAGVIGSLSAFVYKLITNNYKLKTIFTAHGWVFKEARPKIINLLFKIVSQTSTLFIDKIILIDKEDLNIAESFIPPRKLFLIPNGIEQIYFLSKEKAREKLEKMVTGGLSEKTVLIGTIAELTPNKGLDILIEALQRIRHQHSELNFQMIIIGEGSERKELEEKIKLLELTGIVSLPGFVPEASRLLKGLDIFVLPSTKEGLPYVILEALQAGLPIVASRVGGLPDLIEDGRNGLLIPAKDPQVLAKTLYRLIINPEDRKSLGLEASKTKLDLDKMINETLKVYL